MRSQERLHALHFWTSQHRARCVCVRVLLHGRKICSRRLADAEHRFDPITRRLQVAKYQAQRQRSCLQIDFVWRQLELRQQACDVR